MNITLTELNTLDDMIHEYDDKIEIIETLLENELTHNPGYIAENDATGQIMTVEIGRAHV